MADVALAQTHLVPRRYVRSGHYLAGAAPYARYGTEAGQDARETMIGGMRVLPNVCWRQRHVG